jgi:uncharacterized membrane protein
MRQLQSRSELRRASRYSKNRGHGMERIGTPALPLRRQGRQEVELRTNVAARERAVSAVAGGALLLAALARRRALGLALAATGVGLLYRGFSGRCALYRSLGVDTAHGRPLQREIELRRAITIGVAPDRIREELRDPERLPALLPFVRHASEPSRGHWQLQSVLPGGRPRMQAMDALQDARGVIWRGEPDALLSEVSVRLDPAPGARGTELHLLVRARPPGGYPGAVAGRWLRGLAERALGARLGRLKQHLESRETAIASPQPEGARSFVYRSAVAIGEAARGPA